MPKRLCACDCGEAVIGQRSKKFVSDSQRKRYNRGSDPSQGTPLASPGRRETRTQKEPAVGTPDVRELDTKQPVFCPCGRGPLPRLCGPIQAVAYCDECVQSERCPCYTAQPGHG